MPSREYAAHSRENPCFEACYKRTLRRMALNFVISFQSPLYRKLISSLSSPKKRRSNCFNVVSFSSVFYISDDILYTSEFVTFGYIGLKV